MKPGAGTSQGPRCCVNQASFSHQSPVLSPECLGPPRLVLCPPGSCLCPDQVRTWACPMQRGKRAMEQRTCSAEEPARDMLKQVVNLTGHKPITSLGARRIHKVASTPGQNQRRARQGLGPLLGSGPGGKRRGAGAGLAVFSLAPKVLKFHFFSIPFPNPFRCCSTKIPHILPATKLQC